MANIESDANNISIAVTVDGLNVPQILTTTGLTAALVRCDPRTQQPISLRRPEFKPLVGATELFTKPNATDNALGILVKFRDPILTHFAFERRTFLALALFAGEIDPATSVPIGLTAPFFLAELLLARRHTRNTELRWVSDPPPMNPNSKIKVMLVASEVSGGGVDFVQLQFRGEKMRKMDLFSQSDCYFRLRRVFPTAADAPPSVQARARAAAAAARGGTFTSPKSTAGGFALNYAIEYKGKANGDKYSADEIIAEAYQSATINSDANPHWALTNPIALSALCGSDHSAPTIEFACFDEDRFPALSDDPMGMFRVSLSDLIFAAKNPTNPASAFKVTAYSKSTPNKVKEYGTIYCERAEILRRPSCLALFATGWRMRLAVAVDFSTADAGAKSSLHFAATATDPRRNVIARIIAGAGDVMSVYGATTQSTPSLGLTNSSASAGGSNINAATTADAISLFAFGASVGAAGGHGNNTLFEIHGARVATPTGSNSSSSSPFGPSSSSVDMLAAADANVSNAVRRYGTAAANWTRCPQGPKGRAFGTMVAALAERARHEAAQHKIYTVALVIVDEDIGSAAEMAALTDALVLADDAPLSILFVGVNHAAEYTNLSAFEVVPCGGAAAGEGHSSHHFHGHHGGDHQRDRANSHVSMGGATPDEDAELYAVCVNGVSGAAAANHHGGAAPLRHSGDGRRSRRNIAEFSRFFPRMSAQSRHDIAAGLLEGVPMHFVEYSALAGLKA